MSELITRENAKQAICECCYMFKYIGDNYTECRYYPCDDIKALEAIPSAEAAPTIDESDVLRTDIGQGGGDCIKATMSDLISRADAIEAVKDTMKRLVDDEPKGDSDTFAEYCGKLAKLTSINVEILKSLSALPSAEAVHGDGKMIPIELKKRYPHSRDEDITDAFMRGYQAHGEAVQGWIPCSERWPNNDGCVLVTIGDGIEFGKYEDGSWSIWVCEHWDKWDAKGTIAWMPLPEPYKAESEDKE